LRSHADETIRQLQIPGEVDGRYKEDVAGPPILFTVNGTHNHKYTAWVFPDPSTHIKPDCPQRADKICNRFKLVREDLEMALVSEVKVIISELRMPEYDDCDVCPEMWAVIVRMLERKAQL
jgi:hypothetical protein